MVVAALLRVVLARARVLAVLLLAVIARVRVLVALVLVTLAGLFGVVAFTGAGAGVGRRRGVLFLVAIPARLRTGSLDGERDVCLDAPITLERRSVGAFGTGLEGQVHCSAAICRSRVGSFNVGALKNEVSGDVLVSGEACAGDRHR